MKYIRDYSLPAPAMGTGCELNTGSPLLSSTRPNTRFNICIPSSIFKYSWTPSSYLTQPDSANTDVNGIKEPIDYTITVSSASNPNCFAKDVVPIKLDYTNSVVVEVPMNPYILCRPGYVSDLSAQGVGPKPQRNLPCGVNNTVTCTSEITKMIANPGRRDMYDEPLLHPFDGTSTTAHTQYIIPRSLMRNANITSGTLNSLEMSSVSGSSMDFTNLKISLKCTDLEQFSGTAPITFETGTVQVYSSTSEVFAASGYHKFQFTTPYNWDTSKNLLVDICYSQATAGTGPTIKTYDASGFNLMMKSYQTSGDVCTNPSTEIGPVVSQVLPVFRVNFCGAGDTEFVYRWSPGDYFQDSLLQNPVVRIDSSTKVYVQTVGRNGCLVKDSVTIVIPANTRYVTPDASICLNDGIQLRTYNGIKTKWYESKGLTGGTYDKASSLSCDTCDRTIASPKETTTYYAEVTADNGKCIDTFRTSVTVNPLPGVYITNKDTTIKYGQSVLLNAFGASQYYWTPISGVTNANIGSTLVQPLVTTTYVVTGSGVNGCSNKDSVKVTIDYRSPVQVPTAFSPNGDGRNDRFRIVGASFQTLTEFRIFNRWGQEVFSTTNINDGWDGTYNGKPADMGVYNYLITVGYPDGTIQTLKGDVNLVR
ncbi:MAG: gliding motility-associated C-terminal domain-containing protein [Chitinophagaceae bacterium]